MDLLLSLGFPFQLSHNSHHTRSHSALTNCLVVVTVFDALRGFTSHSLLFDAEEVLHEKTAAAAAAATVTNLKNV